MKNYGEEFQKAKEDYYKEHNQCLGAILIPQIKCLGVMTIHHAKGNKGSLMTDKRYFRMLCDNHHKRVHNNYAEALELGLSYPELLECGNK